MFEKYAHNVSGGQHLGRIDLTFTDDQGTTFRNRYSWAEVGAIEIWLKERSTVVPADVRAMTIVDGLANWNLSLTSKINLKSLIENAIRAAEEAVRRGL